MRALLTGFLCWLLAVQPALAVTQCAIEIATSGGVGSTGGAIVVYNTGSSSNTTNTLTTTQSNEPIFVVFFANSEQTTGPAPTVTSISPLSFTRRSQAGGLVTNCYGPGQVCYMAMEVWEAKAASPLAAQKFTVTATTGGSTGAMISSFGITNTVTPSAPFDSNGSLPAIGQQINMISVPPFVSGVSTNNANDLILTFCGSVDNVSITSCTTALTSPGWSGPVAGAGFLNSFINYTLRASVYYKTVSTILSSATLTPETPKSINWSLVGDALVCPGGVASSLLPHIWVHE